VTVLFTLCGIGRALAGPWPLPEGQGLVINSFGFLQAQNAAGIPNPAYGSGTFRRFELDDYSEYGLTDQITLSASLNGQVRDLVTSDLTRSTAGFGDVELGARTVIWQSGPWVAAAQGLVKIPTGYNPNANPAIGNDQVDLEPRLLLGRGFTLGDWSSFVEIEAGFRFRFGGPGDQLRINATLGVHPASRWMLLLQSYNIIGMRNEAPGGTDFDLATVVASAVYDITPRWSAQLGGISDVASRNFNRGNGVFVAIWWKF
jgi:protein XagA